MHMVADAADNHCFETLIVRDARHIGPELRLEIVGEALLSILRGENHVDSIARVGV